MKALLPALVIVLLVGFITGARRGRSSNGPERPAGADGSPAASASRPDRVFDSSCTLTPDPPVRDRSADQILGTVHYRCDRPGGDVDASVYLQKRAPNGTWSTVDSRLIAARGPDTTRDRSDRQRTRTATAPCADGVYRTFVRGTVTVRGKAQPVEKESGRATNPCASPSAKR